MYGITRLQSKIGLRTPGSGVLGQGEPGLRLHSRAALHPRGRHFLLVAMGVEAGHVIVYDLHLLPREVGVLIEDDPVLLAVLLTRSGGISVREMPNTLCPIAPSHVFDHCH